MTTVIELNSSADIRKVQSLPASMRLAFLALRATRNGRMSIFLPDGRKFVFDHGQPGPKAEIHVKDPKLAKRVLTSGDIGFAEAYMDDQFWTPDLTVVLEFFAINFEAAGRLSQGSKVRNLLALVINTLTRRNTKKGSKQNILAHYDLGNDFYGEWLDKSMTYSSGIYETASSTLDEAQAKKYDEIAKSINAEPGDHILEIGSGWGGFAEFVARNYGCKVTSITISDAQYAYARKRIEEAGLADKVNIELKDYRDVEGQFDGVASIEMFEAVGEAFWPGYFEKIASCLKPGGRAALQIITISDDLFESYKKRVDFIQKYIFPGGMLPSDAALRDQFKLAGLQLENTNMFGASYARTLREWSEEFLAKWPEIEPLGYDRSFRNLWEYYLSYCEAGFKTGRTDVGQFTIRKPE